MKLLKLSHFLLYLIFASLCVGQTNQVVFGHLGLKDGLSQNSVVAIAQDSLGFLWMATQDGLNRYDGHEFKYYEKYFWDITKEKQTQLGKLMVDDKGVLWILPDTGVPEKYNEQIQKFEVIPNLQDVKCMFQDKNGIYYFGTSNGLIQRERPESMDSLILNGQSISDGIVDSDNQVWIIIDGEVWTKQGKQNFSRVSFSNIYNNTITPRITCLTENDTGHILAGSFGHGLFFKTKKESHFQTFPLHQAALNNTKILSVLEDQHQHIWIGTYGQGAFLLNYTTKSIQHFKAKKHDPNALCYNDILSIFESVDGNIWLGTDGAGLSFYDKNLSKFDGFTNTQVPSSIQIDVVRAILVDQSQKTWLGLSGKGLTVYDPVNKSPLWKTFTAQNSSLNSNRIMSLEEGHDGKIWIGTQSGGLNIYDPDGKDFKNTNQQKLSNSTIWDIHLDPKNRYWLATRNKGIIEYHLEQGIIHHYKNTNSQLPDNNVRTIINGASSNDLWIGLENEGICHFDKTTQQFTCYKNKNGNPKVKALYLAPNNILWIGTNGGGLEAFNPEQQLFHRFGTEEGLPNNVIYGILPDQEEKLWLSTNQGICQFTPPQDLSTKALPTPVVVYDNYDGLQSFEFNTGAYFIDQNENLYFGGINGYNWFNPKKIKANPVPPKVMLTQFKVNEKNVLPQLRNSKSIHLKHSQNDISFTYSADSYSLPERNQYRYQLVGYDKTENFVGNRHFAQYTNLPPGDYQLVIKASNYDGVWNEDGIKYNILISFPWYNTAFAKGLFLFLSFLILYGIYRFLKRRWALQALLQKERQSALHLKEMNLLKSQLYTNITHEFRTPLTIIKGMIGEPTLDTHAKKMIQDNANQLLHLVNELLDLSKLERGHYQLNYRQEDIIPFLKYLLQSFQSLANIKNQNLHFVAEQESLLMDFDSQKLQQVITNLISNAIKFTPTGGTIILSVKKEETDLKIQITDNGKGIAPEHQKNIFERFYQIEPDASQIPKGSGIGLTLVKELMKLMDGTIQLDSKLNQGSTFTIQLLIQNNASLATHAPALPDTLNMDQAVVSSPKEKSKKEAPIILIIEDNSDVVFYLNTILKLNYDIAIAKNGQEGIQKALHLIPDLIISDVMMPMVDGFELCQTLKQNELSAHIPIILLTAKADIASKKTGLKQGADAYLFKPFDKEELLIRVAQLLKLRQKLQNFYTQIPAISPPAQTIDPFLKKVNDIIAQNLDDENFNTQNLCKALHYSKMQVHRKIKALSDLSTSQYLKQYRLLRAKEMMDFNKKLTVSEIAMATGFNSLPYFSRSFKEQFQVAPSEYMKQNKKN